MMAASVSVTELGFVQECEPWRLRSPQFPSKVGGRPAWLGEVGVPGPERLQCGVCMKPLALLVQVYAPCTGSFHRTVFLFTCRDPTCHRVGERRGYKVFRNQLPRKNDTYSYGPPPDSHPQSEEYFTSFQLKCGLRLCRVCGCLGPKSCSKCHKVNYCDRVHQLMDWKAQHKVLCGPQFDAHRVEVADHGFLFPEYELLTEAEELDSDASLDDDSTMSQMDMESSTLNSSSNLESSMDELKLNEDELNAIAKHESEEDKAFSRFKKRISIEPEQVLRYCKGGEPLWISLQNVPAENDILNCGCGAKRAFEFQVMPQLLNHLKVDSLQKSIDWGVLAVYTCSANCSAETHYVEEFLWKQDVPGDTI
ncbi:programmed cell death protein 2 [Bufo gargarizans]|uniref:programmed cell death protein 2 n=1 Tax=Bufo gargarizans TaxID=30331 RepID=UPI001CF2618F|nr:programmed cell death protein 2 [Bufo gargarizans]